MIPLFASICILYYFRCGRTFVARIPIAAILRFIAELQENSFHLIWNEKRNPAGVKRWLFPSGMALLRSTETHRQENELS